jgi:PBSX family phage terminase large subunit
LGIILSPKQRWSINRSNARLNLWVGSVRSSKTWATIFKWIQYICTAPKGDLLLLGKTNRSVYRNIIRPMEEFLGNNVNYMSGKGELDIFDRKMFVVGANDERAEGVIRGMTCAGALGDEVTLWPESVFNMLLSRMSVTGSQFFGTTNTDNPMHWLKKNIMERVGELDLKIFEFMLEDNPYLSRDFVRNLKKEYTGLWYRRFILALWCIAEGAIYDFFEEREPFVIKKLPTAKYKAVAIDYGTGNPTTFGMYGINNQTKPKCWLEREYYYDSKKQQRQKSDDEYADDLIDFVGNEKPMYTIIDPSAASFKVSLINKRYNSIIINADNDVVNGIRTTGTMWSSGDFAVHTNCKNTIGETYGYIWCPNAQKRGEDKPKKINDHAQDRNRYILQTIFGGEGILDYSQFTQM